MPDEAADEASSYRQPRIVIAYGCMFLIAVLVVAPFMTGQDINVPAIIALGAIVGGLLSVPLLRRGGE